jgi:hypothetical protein
MDAHRDPERKLVRASITTVDAKGTAKHEDRKAP